MTTINTMQSIRLGRRLSRSCSRLPCPYGPDVLCETKKGLSYISLFTLFPGADSAREEEQKIRKIQIGRNRTGAAVRDASRFDRLRALRVLVSSYGQTIIQLKRTQALP